MVPRLPVSGLLSAVRPFPERRGLWQKKIALSALFLFFTAR